MVSKWTAPRGGNLLTRQGSKVSHRKYDVAASCTINFHLDWVELSFVQFGWVTFGVI